MDSGERLRVVRRRIAAAAGRAGRSAADVRLIVVSKRQPPEAMQALVDAGARDFGESQVQEALDKVARFRDAGLNWHFIGHLQSNKARQAAQLFDMIETVDRYKIARLLNEQCQSLDRTLDILVQVNVGEEGQKSGVLPAEAERLLEQLQEFSRLRVLGLMTMPPFFDAPEKVRPFFRRLRVLSEQFFAQKLLGRHGQVELSMGMSGDFEAAIEEGATLVRVGSALFGCRQ